jgi:hypothetical protein
MTTEIFTTTDKNISALSSKFLGLQIGGKDLVFLPVKTRVFDTAIKSYVEQTKNPKPENLNILWHRFLEERVEERGGVKNIEAIVARVSADILFDPANIKWMEEVAHKHANGSINEVVIGWIELSLLSSLVEAQDHPLEIINATKHLIMFEQVRDFVKHKIKTPSPEAEFEASNTILAAICERLPKNKKALFWGVSKEIAAEGINKFDIPQNALKEICDAAIETLLESNARNTSQQFRESSFRRIFVEIFYPEKLEKIVQKVEPQKWDWAARSIFDRHLETFEERSPSASKGRLIMKEVTDLAVTEIANCLQGKSSRHDSETRNTDTTQRRRHLKH